MRLSNDLTEMSRSISRCFSEAAPLSTIRKRKETPQTSLDALFESLDGLGLKEVLLDPDFKESHQLLGVVSKAQGETLLPIPYAAILWGEVLCERAGKGAQLAGIVIENDTQSYDFIRYAPGRNIFLLINPSKQSAKILSFDEISLRSSIDFSQSVCSLSKPGKVIAEISDISERALRAFEARELSGVTASVLTETVEYVKTRTQFGVPIGSFQAVQHTLASAQVMLEGMESLSEFACWALDSDPAQAPLVCPSSIQFATKAAVETIEKCLQMHGGIGFTWEHDLHIYLRRAKFLEGSSGDMSSDILQAISS